MKPAEFMSQLNAVVNTAYRAFKEATKPPFAVWALDNDADFYADDEHYFKVANGFVELATSIKDFALEASVEDVFKNNKIPYSKDVEDYISDQNIYYVRWSIQLYGG